MKLLSGITLSILLGSISIAQAQDIKIGQIAYGGNGCPSGSDMKLVVGSNIVSLGPASFQIDIDGLGQKIQRSACNVAIPIYIPSGQKLVIDSQSQEGGYYQSAHSQLSISQEVFFAGSLGPKVSFKNMPLKDDGNFYGHFSKYPSEGKISSACGKSVNLRINSSITGITSGDGQFIYANKDKFELRFHLEVCR